MFVWIGFLALVTVFLALDLGVFNRNPHKINTKEALRWTALWSTVSVLFSVFIYFAYERHWFGIGDSIGLPSSGWDAALTYLTGYIVELSLSLDNVFVIAVIFGYFHIPQKYQHRVLFWGIIGAVLFRGLMIGAGAILVEQFDWIMYVFGAILLYTAYKMLKTGEEEIHPEQNPIVLQLRKILPVTKSIRREHFFVKWKGKTIAMTPLFVALVVVETTDIMFAFDSIPAIFSITKDPFIVFTSNIFAILGLRSLYFALNGIMQLFRYLKIGLALILSFIGVKMLIEHWVDISIAVSLGVIAGVLATSVLASILIPEKK